MTREEKSASLQRLNEEQLHLAAVMSQSDAHASKCVKLGLNFAEAYPDDYEAYIEAREQYNLNEEEIKRIESEEVEVDDIRPMEDM